jgi:hypothetical protein
MGSLRLYLLTIGVAGAAVVAVTSIALSRRKTAEQRERERRERLSAIGRITDGTVIDFQEMSAGQQAAVQLVIYQYDVAGVSYEASQDVTNLREIVDVHTCKIGLPTSIKYDPHNPGNSIVVAEKWKGLRQ